MAPDKSKRKNTSSLYSPKYLVLGWVFNIPFESQVGVELTTLEFDHLFDLALNISSES